uniref:BTB domain-containing protein n=1 Tax=Panagrolaimus sp. ES5 TaxID=591445 RepID=A0AC34GX28_9BILA
MNAQKIMYKFQMERFEIFKAQDPETGKFDVVFEFNEKKIYAHQIILCTTSSTLKTMISERWNKLNEPIPIKDYSYDDFKEFLIFIYSGECSLTDENIFAMVDIAEFYGIDELKNACEEYLTKMEININNFYQMIETANKYSMIQFKKSIFNFISINLTDFLQSEQFLGVEKSIMKEIIESVKDTMRQEELFEAIYNWSEYQAIQTQKLDKNAVLNELIKKELSPFLPLMKFEMMDADFLIKYVVKIIDENGKLMTGVLQCTDTEKIAAVISLNKNYDFISDNGLYVYWRTNQPIPSTPSKLIINESVDWYLVYDKYGDISVKQRFVLQKSDYLLAEMFTENGFEFCQNCKMFIC